jgi:hypothetical protein
VPIVCLVTLFHSRGLCTPRLLAICGVEHSEVAWCAVGSKADQDAPFGGAGPPDMLLLRRGAARRGAVCAQSMRALQPKPAVVVHFAGQNNVQRGMIIRMLGYWNYKQVGWLYFAE